MGQYTDLVKKILSEEFQIILPYGEAEKLFKSSPNHPLLTKDSEERGYIVIDRFKDRKDAEDSLQNYEHKDVAQIKEVE